MENDTLQPTPPHFEPSQTVTDPGSTSRPALPAAPAPVTMLEKFKQDYQSAAPLRFFGVIDTLLKRPGQLAHILVHKPNATSALQLLVILLFCLAGIGGMMGSFSGGNQLWMVPLKIAIGTVVSAIICLPSLYILICLSGGDQSFGQVSRLLLLSLTLAGILLLGFLPVAWIFSQATESEIFMGVLYLIIWGTGIFFGLRLLRCALEFLNKKYLGALGLWVVVFSMVLLQMSTTLRPIIGTYDHLRLDEKQFFVSHWVELIEQ